jgi:hypothetical protein
LLADKQYLFWVTARNAVGVSSYSASISIYFASTPAAPGTPFRIQTTTQTQLVIGWTANVQGDFGGTQLTGYEVWWNQGSIINTFVKYTDVSAGTLTTTIT